MSLLDYNKYILSVMKRKNGVFPGEDGDEHTEMCP
jgi:hypothetical protein